MFQDTLAWRAHVRKQMRPNAHFAIRHDAWRFMPPGSPRYVGKDVVNYFWPPAEPEQSREDAAYEAQREREIELAELLRLRNQLAVIKGLLKLRRLVRKYGYNPAQPRDDHGQSSSEGGSTTGRDQQAGRVSLAQADKPVTDDSGKPYYRPGGYHEMPEAVYKKWKNLPSETRRVFRQSSTGPLKATIRTTPEGVRQGNVWDGAGGLHLSFNNAVEELGNRFIQSNKLSPDGSDMRPAHAMEILKDIRMSEDPRIRDFNVNIRRIQRLGGSRGGSDD
jgi:hypothetical protein